MVSSPGKRRRGGWRGRGTAVWPAGWLLMPARRSSNSLDSGARSSRCSTTASTGTVRAWSRPGSCWTSFSVSSPPQTEPAVRCRRRRRCARWPICGSAPGSRPGRDGGSASSYCTRTSPTPPAPNCGYARAAYTSVWTTTWRCAAARSRCFPFSPSWSGRCPQRVSSRSCGTRPLTSSPGPTTCAPHSAKRTRERTTWSRYSPAITGAAAPRPQRAPATCWQRAWTTSTAPHTVSGPCQSAACATAPLPGSGRPTATLQDAPARPARTSGACPLSHSIWPPPWTRQGTWTTGAAAAYWSPRCCWPCCVHRRPNPVSRPA
ncbi:hypothetical protein STENM36S_02690 [Streptomyces tendae]